MGNVLILNGSPRAPRSNSKRYAAIFAESCSCPTESCLISASNHAELCSKWNDFSDVLLVFPLYADGIPVSLLNFLKTVERNPPEQKPVVSVLVNCGFLEYRQNDTAVAMVKLFCRQNGFPFGSVLEIGAGEAILDTPFRGFAARKIRKLAASVAAGRYCALHATMPLPASLFLKASTKYWLGYGEKNGVTREQMETMEIEGEQEPPHAL